MLHSMEDAPINPARAAVLTALGLTPATIGALFGAPTGGVLFAACAGLFAAVLVVWLLNVALNGGRR